MVESAVVAIVLFIPVALNGFKLSEIICSVAVLFTFKHAQIADRMQEKQAILEKPDVYCYRWSNRYFTIKEALWITFFLMIGSYAALCGSILFFVYPFWRRLYRKRIKPLAA